jgi:probable rRNA maturation factor
MPALPRIEVNTDCDRWTAHPQAEAMVARAIAAAATHAPGKGDVAVLLTNDAALRALNAQWRGIDKPTNVLSFPGPAASGHLGDIAIACETLEGEAKAENKGFLDHLAHLSIHGYLHLMGFDHETDEEAQRMEALETLILAQLGIADPYAERTSAD